MKIYFTKRVKNELPLEVSFAIIESIKEVTVKLDYLQILKLEVISQNVLAIHHTQEQPEYSMTYYVTGNDLFDMKINNLKLYMILEETYATLMLADEY